MAFKRRKYTHAISILSQITVRDGEEIKKIVPPNYRQILLL
jgi:hypothetical protein